MHRQCFKVNKDKYFNRLKREILETIIENFELKNTFKNKHEKVNRTYDKY